MRDFYFSIKNFGPKNLVCQLEKLSFFIKSNKKPSFSSEKLSASLMRREITYNFVKH